MAKVTDTVAGQVEQVKKFVDSVRDKYKRAYDRAMDQSRISEIGKIADDIAPVIRSEVSKRIDVAQKWLDTVNQSLAAKALPQDRRKVVKRMKLDEKSKAKPKAKKVSSKSQNSKKAPSSKKDLSPKKATSLKTDKAVSQNKTKKSVGKTAKTTASKKTASVKKRSVKK